MKVVVCVKQVPDSTNVRIDPKTNTLQREGVESIVNPFDAYALEQALRVKDRTGAEVTVVSMGPPQATAVLREAVKRGLGVDDTLVDSVLDDSLIDPRSALEPILHPVLDELELSRAYLADRHSIRPAHILLMGLSAGAAYWCKYAQESHRLELAAPGVFDGLDFPAKPKPGEIDESVQTGSTALFLPALGAALAAAEVEG